MDTALVKRLVDFVDASPTAYHAVDNIAAALEARGATCLDEKSSWKLEPGAIYFVRRSGSALIAFRPGLRSPAEEGFALAGAHTDSPALKLRFDKSIAARGMDRSPVEVYGGPIVSTWLDRPLSLAGRVAIRTQDGRVESRLVNFARPVGLIPNIAIHLNRDLNKGFEYNAQTQLPVLLGSKGEEKPIAPAGSAGVAGAAAAAAGSAAAGGAAAANAAASAAAQPPRSPIASLIAQELGLDETAILGADLYFVDAQKTALFGAGGDLLNGYRLDDLLGCHAVLEAFLKAQPSAHGQVACFLDNEEIGSRSVQGADSSFMRDLLGRVSALQGCSSEGFYRALAASFQISVDVAQAWHPAYAEKYDESFAPILNGGPAVKVNANLRYATDAEGEARFRLLCAAAGVPCQKFQSRADLSPGSTIGPLSSSLMGVRTVDIGHPLLSMHSIRETAGARDHEAMVEVLARSFSASPKD